MSVATMAVVSLNWNCNGADICSKAAFMMKEFKKLGTLLWVFAHDGNLQMSKQQSRADGMESLTNQIERFNRQRWVKIIVELI